MRLHPPEYSFTEGSPVMRTGRCRHFWQGHLFITLMCIVTIMIMSTEKDIPAAAIPGMGKDTPAAGTMTVMEIRAVEKKRIRMCVRNGQKAFSV